jgi:hypothetical protein
MNSYVTSELDMIIKSQMLNNLAAPELNNKINKVSSKNVGE